MNPRHLEGGQQAEALVLATLQAADVSLVVVEVRCRQGGNRGSAAETVGGSKQHKLALAAKHLLQTHPELRRKPLRFDVVAVTGAQESDAVEWIHDAFQAG